MLRTSTFVVLVSFLVGTARGEDPFAAAIRPTEPLSPEAEQKAFHLPPGFRIELFAAEPDIQKPINMAFDARGRLWVAGSTDYPFPAKPGTPGRDSIKILEDSDGDGRADKITTFADGLTIPIGVYPYRDGAIAFSVPYIYYLADTDGDDKADRREVLYGPVGYERDTHGLNNAFRRGFDGWIYACHGFANSTTLEGRDGSKVDMHSGNTYRFRPDGSHVEQFTHGQVNPFGMTLDPLGHIYTADCHTKPIMLLMQGGYYDSFGKPHDGLGYVPSVMKHEHGSTAIAGTTCYTGSQFPAEFAGNMFVGNVMTSRVNRDSLDFVGSTIQAREQPDFVWTDDPWFRPVDLQSGPDGALYIADFYNRIIAHVEIPLNHPGRDKERGRIWRVTYAGTPQQPAQPQAFANLRTASVEQLIAALAHPSLTWRLRATDELSDRIGDDAVGPLKTALLGDASSTVKVHALWALHRLAALDEATVLRLAGDGDAVVRNHAIRALGDTPAWSDAQRAAVIAALEDKDPFARRVAVEALAQHARAENVPPLFELSSATPAGDVHLRHALKMAIRNSLVEPGALGRVAGGLKEQDRHVLAEICLGLANEDSGKFLLDYLRSNKIDEAPTRAYLAHIAKHVPSDEVEAVAGLAQAKAADDVDLQLELLIAARGGFAQRGLAETPTIRDWAKTLAGRLFDSVNPIGLGWTSRKADGSPAPMWDVETRPSADGLARGAFLSSLSLGESWTGSLRSREFTIPARLRFFVCGHLGFPDRPIVPDNWVRLRSATTNEVLAEAQPPRSDVAKEVVWDLKSRAGEPGYLEVVDGVDVGAYAWVAVGRFEPPVVNVPAFSPKLATKRQLAAADLVASLKLTEFATRLSQLTTNADAGDEIRAASASALATLKANAAWSGLARAAADANLSGPLRESIFAGLSAENSGDADALVIEVMKAAPERAQVALAEALASTQASAETLLSLIEQGRASAFLLRNEALKQRLVTAAPRECEARIARVVETLPERDEAIVALMAQRRQMVLNQPGSIERGAAAFKERCGVCHQVGGQGAVIGPQLDGIGNRGLDRVLEDVLDPNRNIDPAFRTTFYVLDDGRIVSGLFRREEGQLIVVADQQGKEQSFAKETIDEQQPSRLSLMPENLGKAIPEGEFADLFAYLLSQRTGGGK